MEINTAFLYLIYIIEIQSSRSQIPWISILFILILYHVINHIEICIRNCSFSSYHQMPFIIDCLGNTSNCILKMCNVCSDCSISSSQNLSKLTPVICQHKCKSIQLPGQPDWSVSCPGHKVAN